MLQSDCQFIFFDKQNVSHLLAHVFFVLPECFCVNVCFESQNDPPPVPLVHDSVSDMDPIICRVLLQRVSVVKGHHKPLAMQIPGRTAVQYQEEWLHQQQQPCYSYMACTHLAEKWALATSVSLFTCK
jgi:hypothetical protein